MFCLNCICTDTRISLHQGRFYARCAKNSSLYREYRYIEDRYIGFLSHKFYCNFCRDSIFIVIPGISLYRGSLYRGSTVSINVKNILYVKELCNEIYSQKFKHQSVLSETKLSETKITAPNIIKGITLTHTLK